MLRKMPTSIIKQQRVGSQQQRHTIRQIQANEREKKVRGIEIRHCPVSTVFIAHFLFAANENLNNFVAIFFHCFYFNMKHWCCEGDATFKYNVWNKWGRKQWKDDDINFTKKLYYSMRWLFLSLFDYSSIVFKHAFSSLRRMFHSIWSFGCVSSVHLYSSQNEMHRPKC